MSGPVYESSTGKVNTTTGSNAPGDKPTGTVDGDLLLAFITCSSGATVNTLSGWTAIASVANTTGVRCAAFWKFASGEGSGWTFTLSGPSNSQVQIMRISGADPTTPVNTSSTKANNSSSTTCANDGLTTTVNNCLNFYHYGINTGTSFTPNANATERQDTTTGGRSATTASEAYSTAGTTGSRNCTAANASPSCSIAVAIAPAAANDADYPLMVAHP